MAAVGRPPAPALPQRQEAAFLPDKGPLCPAGPSSTFVRVTHTQVSAHLALPLPPFGHPHLTRTPSGSFHSPPFSLRRDLSRPLRFLPWNPRGRGVPGLSARVPAWAPGHSSGPPPTAHRDPAQPRWKSSLSGLHPDFTDNYVMPVHTRFHSTSAPTRAPSTLTQAVPRRENASRPEGTPGGRASWGHNQSPRLGPCAAPRSDPQGAQPPSQRRTVTSRSQFSP